MNQTREMAAVIDIGTSTVRAIVGRLTPDRKLDVLAFNEVMSKGVRNGVVVNIDEAAQAIQTAVSSLERDVKIKIKKIFAGISGQKISTRKYSCYRPTENGVVTEAIIRSLVEEARKHAVNSGEIGYHVIPQDYSVDGEKGVENPVGMSGRRIEAMYNVIVASENYEQNLRRSLGNAGYELAGVFVNAYVQGDAYLSRDEREAGVVLIDFGAGTTGVSLYFENVLRLACELPFGGNVISTDIREGCSIIPRHAEMVKKQCGFAFSELAPENKVAQIPEVDGWPAKEISFKNLSGIIQARLEEILDGVNFQLESTGLVNRLGAGVVITGGGSHMRGIDKLVSFITGLEVRTGKPVIAMKEELFNEKLRTPEMANVMGLLLSAIKANALSKNTLGLVESAEERVIQSAAPTTKKAEGGIRQKMTSIFGKAKDGFNGLLSDEDNEIE